MRPNLEILCADIYKSKSKFSVDKEKIKFRIVNRGRFSAVNLRVEACLINKLNEKTCHIFLDRSGFIILPSKLKGRDNTRVFKSKAFDIQPKENALHEQVRLNNQEKLNQLKAGEYLLRVRVHSYHDFSGLGKATEETFNLSS